MKEEVVVGKYTLESLTNGMYADPLDLYREYIQNAVDSIDAEQEQYPDEQYQIKINIEKLTGSISISDNGGGISSDNAIQTLVDIGNSEKDRKKNRGFRGIGRLAGLGYCDKLTFITSHAGEAVKTKVEFDTRQLRKSLFLEDKEDVSINDVMKKIVTISSGEESFESHYFEVLMEGVAKKEKLLDAETVENYLIQHAPLPYKKEFLWADIIKEKCSMLGYKIPEYCIFLNGELLNKPYTNTFTCDRVKKRRDSIHDIDVMPFYRDGQLAALLWYGVIGFYGTILDNRIKGIRIRQGNLLIGDKSTCNALFKEERFNGWMVGELHVMDPELIVNARRDYFERNEAHYNLTEAFFEWSTDKAKEIRKLSYERNLSEKQQIILAADLTEDIDDICPEELDINYGESELIDSEEPKEVAGIDFMNKLSSMLNHKNSNTKYAALNINDHLTLEQKKTLEKVFDIITNSYGNEEAAEIITIIAANI